MSWLAVLIADIADNVIRSLGGDLFSYLNQKKIQAQAQATTQAQSQASVSALNAASTGQQIDDASNQAFDQT